jgi:hypothetical protein
VYEACGYKIQRELQMVKQGREAIEQGHDHIFLFHGYLQVCELFHNKFFLVNVVDDVVPFVNLDG